MSDEAIWLMILVVLSMLCPILIFSHLVKIVDANHKAVIRAIYKKHADTDNVLTPDFGDINPTKKKRKGKVYRPSKDTHKVLTGEIVDPYD